MEGPVCQVAWGCYVLLAISIGAHCAMSSDNLACPSTSDLRTQPVAALDKEGIGPAMTSIPMIACSTSLSEHHSGGSGTNKNKQMVEQLQRYGVISSKKVVEVMETIDRALFVPDGTPAYVDSPMAIGYNATISAPHMHATCLQLLEENLQPGMHALDVGSDGREGWPEHAPYDAIHVGAAAPEIPQPLIDQLKPGGRMVIPVGKIFQDLQVVDKNLDGSVSIRSETAVRYVPLTSRDAQLKGY
ncbi:protein-L-isoaspartate O-methyltransferase-like isoform X2 [Gossypium arboreum]|uniref:protein-L-isoaspartate O-methyltransferase-like isoform X2 n=1 Tax=Gossypium arboreum TaxID=29729 RepID=UPI0008195A9B|nr:protein-L-isoaspartate O-methyltransferase-like isoform X2 [Gossypium arboreum]